MEQTISAQSNVGRGISPTLNLSLERVLMCLGVILAGLVAALLVSAAAISVISMLLLALFAAGIAMCGVLISSKSGEFQSIPLAASSIAVSLMCVITLLAETPVELALVGVMALASVGFLWTGTVPHSTIRRGLGPLLLFTLTSISAVLIVLVTGWNGRVSSDAQGLAIAALVPAICIVLTRSASRSALIPVLLTISIGVLALDGPERFDRWIPVIAALTLAEIVLIVRRESVVGPAFPYKDIVLTLLLGSGLFACVLFNLNEPIRSLLLGLTALAVLQVITSQRLLIRDREMRVQELARINARVERIANLDHLTGLPNRAALSNRLNEEVERSVRYRHPMSVCFVDIDHFKLINDSLGHAVGDQVLQQIASVIRSTIRTPDFVARFGGEEFVVIAPGTWSADAVILGDRIQRAIADQVEQPLGRPITVSIGIAGVPEHGTDSLAVLERADQALYAAKFGGRNRVEIATGDDSLDPA